MIETISNTSSLATRLRERIRREGPILFCDWMKAALYDPGDGYYCRADRTRWGREGDYRTSPERSRLFAATFARYFAGLHEDLGRPSAWTILEAGAGEGHFARELLQTLQQAFPDVFAATSSVIDEVSSLSGTRARARLLPFADRVQFKGIDEVDINPGVVFANELLDAFPVHRITLHAGEFKEFYVSVDKDGNFQWLLDAPSNDLAPSLGKHFALLGVKPEEGKVVEVSLEIEAWLRTVAAKLRNGYLITVDYGAATENLYSPLADGNGTLRGFQRHQFVADLLAQPGEHDLTTTVNWSFVKAVGARLGFEVLEFERQDRFLLAAGFLHQLELESLNAENETERLRLSTEAREMILPDGMAARFQVLVQKKTS
ncbi:MAG: class I SAM-dependent methyltransferase [Pyrinomonadaceae bacterium]